jgi:Domain of unknown function (DUF4118)
VQSAGKYRAQWASHLDLFRAMAPLPLAIGAVLVAARFGFSFPNPPAALLLPLAYCAYRGGLAVGLVAAALHVGYSALFFSLPGAPFYYDAANLVRTLVIVIVAPSMATMIGILRQKAELTPQSAQVGPERSAPAQLRAGAAGRGARRRIGFCRPRC